MVNDTHIITPLAPSVGHGQFVARCGSVVYGGQHVDAHPTCADCARLEDDDTRSLRELQAWNDELTAQGR